MLPELDLYFTSAYADPGQHAIRSAIESTVDDLDYLDRDLYCSRLPKIMICTVKGYLDRDLYGCR